MTPRRKRARKAIAIREIAAAALSMMLDEAQRTELREHKVPAKSIIALFEPHHVIFFALGGADRWWNFHMMLKQPHRERSAKDTTTIAHVKRVSKSHEEFRRRVLKPAKKSRVTRDKWPQGRKLQSRPFQQKNRE